VAPTVTLIADDKKTKVPNPEFAIFVAKQHVLNFLFSSLSKEMLERVASCSTPHEVWENLVTMSSSQSHARVINTRMTLSTTRKGNLSVAQYIDKMKTLADDMTSAGKKLEDEDLVSYILAGLDSDFDSVISAISARVEPISVVELYGQLVFHEQRHELRGKEYAMANAAARGRGSSPPARGGHGASSRGRGGPGHGHGRNNDPNVPRVECQLCGKK
jgi:hypothetical protein